MKTLIQSFPDGSTRIHLHTEEYPNELGGQALAMLHARLQAGIPLDMDNIQAVAKRYCNLAAAMFAEMRERGWVVKVPEPTFPPERPEFNLGFTADKK